jgi:hypothetical protein
MSPESVQPTEPVPAEMGEVSRLSGVFFEPSKTFEAIGLRPKWLAPLALIILSGIVFYYFFGQRVTWERYFRQQNETNKTMQQQMANMTAQERERTITIQAKYGGIGFYAAAIIFVPLVFVVNAAVLLGITSMMSAALRFKQVFAVVCYAGLPMAIKQILSTVVLFLKNPEDFNITNPLAFNPGAFMDPVTTSKFVYTIASNVDAFAIWGLILTAIGLSAVAGKRLKFGGAMIAVLIPYVALVLFGATMASMFS